MQDGRTKTQANLWRITRGQRLRYLSATAATGVSSGFMLLAPLVGMYAIDVIVERDFDKGSPWLVDITRLFDQGDAFLVYLGVSALAGLLLASLSALFMYLRGRWSAMATEAIARRLRDALFHRLHHLPARFFDEADTGDLVQRCSSDVETVRVFLATNVVEIGRSILLITAMAPILFWRDARLAALSLCLMPFITVGAYLFFSLVKRQFKVADEAEGKLTAVLQENLTGIRVVRAFARDEHEIGRFATCNRAFRDHLYRLNRLEAMYWGISDFVSLGQISVVVIAAGIFLAQGTISVGELFAFLTLVSMAIWPVRRLGHVLADSGKAVISLKRINHILEAEVEPPSRSPAPVRPRERADGGIVFDRVSADYQPGKPVVVNFSVHIPAGQTVGIVGAPGSGKSTLIRLLMRLYPVTDGRILIDGTDIRDVDGGWLRHQIGVVMQDPFLYSRSIAANLRVARPDADEAHLVEAAQEAAIHDAIAEFPAGYEAPVGERGITLSGGQRQRLALARALLKDPPVLVLDDSLSAVDTNTERRILNALAQRRGRHTTIVIAHRLSSVKDADRILVLKDGKLAQDGSHAALATAPGPYQRLCEIQGALDESIRADLGRAVGLARR
ncbi:MAG: ABC transporter ATP-binding protein [Gammaproteobacteria bacterium]|nr:ABC transporter ATP-binding protein [Gammaproteobacteria bacterium]